MRVRLRWGSVRRTRIARGPPRGTSRAVRTSTRGAPVVRSPSAGAPQRRAATSVSALLTWNTFPLPQLTSPQRNELADAGKAVLDARALYPDTSLATLYERNGVVGRLLEAHQALDRVVDKVIAGRARTTSESDRLRALFTRYSSMSADGQLSLPPAGRPGPGRRGLRPALSTRAAA